MTTTVNVFFCCIPPTPTQGVIFSAPDALGRLPLDASVRVRINGSALDDTTVRFQPGEWRQNNGPLSDSTTDYYYSGFLPLQAALQQVRRMIFSTIKTLAGMRATLVGKETVSEQCGKHRQDYTKRVKSYRV